MDLGFMDIVDVYNQGQKGRVNTPAIVIPSNTPVGWDNPRAITLSKLLNEDPTTDRANNQRSGLSEFLALYWVTKNNVPVTNIGADIQTALFRGRTDTWQPDANRSMISHVHVGDPAKDDYPGMHKVLKQLGITSSAVVSHKDHFYIYVRPPAPLIFGQNLLASADSGQAQPVRGGVSKSIPKHDAIVNECRIVGAFDDDLGRGKLFFPRIDAVEKFYGTDEYKSLEVTGISLVKQPAHGVFQLAKQPADCSQCKFEYEYIPTENYFGPDNVKFLVELNNGKKVLVQYDLSIIDHKLDIDLGCPVTPDMYRDLYESYKITPPHGQLDGGSQDDIMVGIRDTWLDAYQLIDLIPNTNDITINVDSFKNGAIGHAMGQSITLDTNTAGPNWFTDYTPYLNEEHARRAMKWTPPAYRHQCARL